MELNEQAREYAINVLEEQIGIVAKAYMDGYNAAKGIYVNNGTNYIDLGLPSGTRWSSFFDGGERKWNLYTWQDAKALNIPSREQYLELKENCKIVSVLENVYYDTFHILGPNGKSIIARFPKTSENLGLEKGMHFSWYKSSDASAMCFDNHDLGMCVFQGLRLPVFLVE